MVNAMLSAVPLKRSFVFTSIVGLNSLESMASMLLCADMIVLEGVGHAGLLLQSIDNPVFRIIVEESNIVLVTFSSSRERTANVRVD